MHATIKRFLDLEAKVDEEEEEEVQSEDEISKSFFDWVISIATDTDLQVVLSSTKIPKEKTMMIRTSLRTILWLMITWKPPLSFTI